MDNKQSPNEQKLYQSVLTFDGNLQTDQWAGYDKMNTCNADITRMSRLCPYNQVDALSQRTKLQKSVFNHHILLMTLNIRLTMFNINKINKKRRQGKNYDIAHVTLKLRR